MTEGGAPRDPAAKVRDWDAATRWREAQSGPVVFTNGVFDLLHPGHVDLLLGARRAGDHLVVGLNSDQSVRRLKGPERPVRNEAERAYVLAALEAVDCVVVFEEDTPLELSTNGDVLVVTPVRDRAREKKLKKALEDMDRQYGGVFKRLAE